MTAILLITRERLIHGPMGGSVASALDSFRNDTDAYKAKHPQRDWATASDLTPLTIPRRRDVYQKLLKASTTVLARIERNKIQFSSLVELDNYLIANLPSVD